MLRKEWSLIVNSLLVQSAVGLFLFIVVFHYSTGISNNETMQFMTGFGLNLAGLLVVLGMFVSLFHLGNPFRAPLAVKNISSSWLSREIIFTSAFAGLWLLSVVLKYTGIDSQLLVWLTFITGIVAVISMASIYYTTGKSGWANLATYTSFLGSVVVFGTIGFYLLVSLSGSHNSISSSFLRAAFIIFIAVLLVKSAYQLLLISRLKPEEKRSMNLLVSASSGREPFVASFKSFTLWGILLSLAGTGLFAFSTTFGEIESGSMAVVSCLLVLFGEILGRSGFYSLGLTK